MLEKAPGCHGIEPGAAAKEASLIRLQKLILTPIEDMDSAQNACLGILWRSWRD